MGKYNPMVGMIPGAHPFQFPIVPTSGTQGLRMAPNNEYRVLDSTHPLTLYEAPKGQSGIIRNISLVLDGSIPTAMSDILFNVAYDGETVPSISVPLRTLFSLEYPDIAFDNLRVRTGCFEITHSRTPIVGGLAGTWAMNFKLPILYTNGIKVYLTETAGGGTTFWPNIIVQNYLPTAWNNNLRLFVDRVTVGVTPLTAFSKTLQLSTPTNLKSLSSDVFVPSDEGKIFGAGQGALAREIKILRVIDPRNALVDIADTYALALNTNTNVANKCTPETIFTRPSGEVGWLAMMTFSLSQAVSDEGVYESNPRLYVDGELPSRFVWTSIEDFANGAFFFAQAPICQGEHGGLTCRDNVDAGVAKIASMYKSFYDYPILYTNGILGQMLLQGTAPITNIWNTFYYKVMGL